MLTSDGVYSDGEVAALLRPGEKGPGPLTRLPLSPEPGPGPELDTSVSILPCGHVYHTACIRRHVTSFYECKVCHCPATIPSISNVKLTALEAKGNKQISTKK